MVTPFRVTFICQSFLCSFYSFLNKFKSGLMAQKSIDMNLAKQVQQLRNDGVPIKEIVRRTGISRKTVKKYLRLMEQPPGQIEGKKSILMADKEMAAIIYNNDIA